MVVTKTTTYDGIYIIDTYTGSGTTSWTVPSGVTSIESLIVAGGGSGGASDTGGGGGGGAGGFRAGGMSVTPGEEIYITVGAGGTSSSGRGVKGGNSTIRDIVIVGGGYGGMGSSTDHDGGPGGSGGGSGGYTGGIGGSVDGSNGNIGGSITGSSSLGGAGGGGILSAGSNNSGSTGGSGGTGNTSTLIAGTHSTGGNGGNYSGTLYGAGSYYLGYNIGGGSGYSPIYTSGNYTVTSYAQLVTAMNSAVSGNVIFIPSTATIDMTGQATFTIKAGVILASNRGSGSSTGGLIKRDTSGSMPLVTLSCGGGNRITGLRIQGPHLPYGVDHGEDVHAGISATDKTNIEVDNCELSGWSYTAVAWENTGSGSYSANIHHNYIHHCSGIDYGYGIMVGYGTVTIGGNIFDYCRHAITGYGGTGESYTYCYNIYQSDNCIDTVHDIHGGQTPGLSGRLYSLHHNTSYHTGDYALDIAGTPSESITITNNDWMTGTLVRNGTTRISMTDNKINGTIYPTGPISE